MTGFLILTLIIVIIIIICKLLEVTDKKVKKPVAPYVPRQRRWFYTRSAENMPKHPNRAYKGISFLTNDSIVFYGDFDNPSKNDMIVCIMKSGAIGIYRITDYPSCYKGSSFDGPSEYMGFVKLLGTFSGTKEQFAAWAENYNE